MTSTSAGTLAPLLRPRVLDPLALAGGLGGLVLLATALDATAGLAAQPAMAGVVAAFFAAAVALSPVNGLVLLFLVVPFFNGDDFHPYFFLLEVLVYLTLLRGLVPGLGRRPGLRVPHAPVLGLFLLSTVISLPLNLRELGIEVGLSSWREAGAALLRGDLRDNLFYVRTVLDVLSGLGLYILVANAPWTRTFLQRLALAATAVYLAVSLLGLGLYWFGPLARAPFLSVYLHGSAAGGFSGLGFNSSYFAQYALGYLPMAALVLCQSPGRASRILAGAALAVSGYTILLTYQRGAYVVLLVEVVLLALVGRRAARAAGGASLPRRAVLASLAGVLVAALAILAATPVGGHLQARLLALWSGGDPIRSHLARVAWRMLLDEPVLGIGSGRFAHVYRYYSETPALPFGSWSAHDLYLQLLAEQGLLGLASFLAVVGVTLAPLVRRRSAVGASPAVLFVAASLGAWLVYGLLQYTFLLRSMQVYFWIALGLVAALTAAPGPERRVDRRRLVLALLVLAIPLALRIHAIAVRPLLPGYTAGVYGWEWLDERTAAWTRRSAFFTLRVQGRTLVFALASPVSRVVERPQTVTVVLDGVPVRRIRFETPAWQSVVLAVDKPIGSPLFLQLRTAYTVVPARLGVAPDIRELGVLVTPPYWSP